MNYRILYAGRWIDVGRREAWALSVARRLSMDEPTPILLAQPADVGGHWHAYYRGVKMA